jgi:hypothetical protein
VALEVLLSTKAYDVFMVAPSRQAKYQGFATKETLLHRGIQLQKAFYR